MALKLYNTLTRKVEAFKPIKDKKVGIYSCGPTVYDFAHIGNFRAYVCVDILKRYLKYKGYKIKHVMNLTDVDDKTIRGSIKENISISYWACKRNGGDNKEPSKKRDSIQKRGRLCVL